ncbi:MAG: hypothetical protein JJ900_13215 [Rhodospirillales bacterium]|nr:hypothetical protein [Rhodospirillales bacterium]MBO6787805.1 hypothetical protein [Rhodospirillales bacterium]
MYKGQSDINVLVNLASELEALRGYDAVAKKGNAQSRNSHILISAYLYACATIIRNKEIGDVASEAVNKTRLGLLLALEKHLTPKSSLNKSWLHQNLHRKTKCFFIHLNCTISSDVIEHPKHLTPKQIKKVCNEIFDLLSISNNAI